MLLTDLPNHIECSKVYNLNKNKIKFKYIYTNSQDIKKKSILVIRNKKNFKSKYLKESIDKGAVAVITSEYIKNIKITQYVVKNIDISLNYILNYLYPNKPLNSISLTGTNGKTSVAWYISQISYFNKFSTQSFGTLGYYKNLHKKNDSNLTTPLYEVLHQIAFSKNKNLSNFIFEASSHALDQNRLGSFYINIAAITNISRDHLDYHKNFRNYKKAKYKLFTKYLTKDGTAILNDNIKEISKFKKSIKKRKIITYGKKNSDIFLERKNKKIEVNVFKKKYNINMVKFSKIELENISCAIACCYCLNIDTKNILMHLSKLSNPPGRLERVTRANYKFQIFIDYAHTPDALKQVLIDKSSKNKKPNIVFGCGGNRDLGKRKEMGMIASRYADKVYITDDNPRDENPYLIRKSILSRCKKGIEISDRKEAICKAIKDLKKNDVLIIAGKGHEKIQIIKNSKKNFDDLKIAQKQLEKIIND